MAWCVPGRRLLCGVAVQTVLGVTAAAFAQTRDEFEALKRQMEQLMRQNAEQQRQIEQLQRQVHKLGSSPPGAPGQTPPALVAAPTPPVESEIDQALAEVRPPTQVAQPAKTAAVVSQPALLTRRVGGAELRLIDVSLDLLTAAGWSTVGGQNLRDLEAGAHDPNRRGFTLQQGELSLAGAVDPYFLGEAHVIFTDSDVELEEAFFTTTALPYDLQLRGGYFFLDFGRINPTHPHAWTYLDQPVILSRLMGGEGLRSVGAELSWLAPLPWFSQLEAGVANADQTDLAVSFLNSEGGIGGRPAVTASVNNVGDLLYLARSANAWDISPEISSLGGVSGLYGPNSTGSGTQTFIYGTDLTVKWRPLDNFRGWPFLVWQTEAMKRDYTAARFLAGTAITDDDRFPNDLPGAILRDYGFYSYLLWGFAHPWALGVRAEYATGVGRSVIDGSLVSRQLDPLRGDRLRISPMLVYHASEFSRVRLQYNFDNAKFLPDGENASSVWLGLEVLYGTHPAHKY